MKKMINIFMGSFDFKQIKKRRKFFARLIQVELLVVVFLLAACSSGGGNGGSNVISSVTYTPSVSTGPGVIATQAVDVTKNSTIIIQSPGNALHGTTIYIPANTLGTNGTNTISIGYTDTLQALLIRMLLPPGSPLSPRPSSLPRQLQLHSPPLFR